MLDTVILNIPRHEIRGIPDGRGGRSWDLYSRTGTYEKYVKNPPRALRDGVYRPRLTGMRRLISKGVYASFLKVEFSAPKLLFRNNLEEVAEKDFGRVIDQLQERLLEAGVIVSAKVLASATVAAFHPSKNIVLSDGYTASYVSRELSKINLNKKFDLDKSSYRNGGQSLQAYTQAHAVAIYDKVADLGKSKKRAIDKDQVPEQLSLFRQIRTEQPSLEVLRFEVRLTQRQKINGVLKRLGLGQNLTFEQVFKKDVCQKIVQFYWDTLVEGENLFLFATESNPKNLLKRVLQQHPKMRAKDAIYLVGLDALCNDDGGIRDLRSLLEKRQSQRGWYRITDGITLLNDGRSDRQLHSWVRQVREAIKQFQPYRARPP